MGYQFKHLLVLLKDLRQQPLLTLLKNSKLKDIIEPLIFRLRWLMPLAILFRYMLHHDVGLGIFKKEGFYFLFSLFIIHLLISTIQYQRLRKRDQVLPHDWRVFTSWASLLDTLFITLFYILARNPRSEIPFLYFIPLVWSMIFMPVRNNLFGLLTITLSFTISTPITIYLSSVSFDFSELLLVLMPKAIFLPIVVLYLLWVNINLNLSENIIKALFDNSPEGISFIGQKKSHQINTLVDMQILKINSAQQKLTPSAKVNSESCRTEFISYSKNHEDACPWCPASPILENEAKQHRSLTKTILKSSTMNDIEKEEILFSDASASPCEDEKGMIIAAVKFVKDVTPQVYLAYLAGELFLFQNEEEVLKKASEFFRKMYKAESVKIAKLDKSNNLFSIIAQATKEHPLGTIVSELPITISTRSIITLEKCPSEVDIIEKGTDQPNCLLWCDYCTSESPYPLIQEIASNFDLECSLIVPVKTNTNLWGLILITRENNGAPSSYTQLDVLHAQMAAQITSVAMERTRILKDKDATLEQIKETTKLSSALQILCSDMVKVDNYEKVIALSLIGITCRPGLKYSRAIFLKCDDNYLRFQFGIGPITSDDAKLFWNSVKMDKIVEYYEDANWYENILENNLTALGKDQHYLSMAEISNSVVTRAIKNIQALKGDTSDVFVKSSLAKSLRIDNEFVVSPTYSRGIVEGIVIADKKYLEDGHISIDEINQLLFLTAFTGTCSAISKIELQFKNSPLQFLISVHEIIKKKYQEKGINVFQLANITEKISRSLNFSIDDINAAKISALAVNFVHLSFSDNLLFGKQKIDSLDDQYLFYIRKHPEIAKKLVRKIGGPELSAISAYQHHILFNEYPEKDKGNLTSIAKILAICESYLALVYPKKYSSVMMTSDDAISELRHRVKQEDIKLIEILREVIKDEIE